ncbi:hypothetical protein BDV93DRAFT_434591 [Ceratobasidium sp. AG-I]|nr:hypothetical protein BDV93DRAFT_461260 [Ceratobasidium sp. AG-I]KAF8608025.1 hypothetical protein BDV93DRAFT_434591 [Ceratobasidium sp. AG-I]
MANYYARADKALSQYLTINTLEQRAGIPKTYLAAGAAGLVTRLVTVNARAVLANKLVVRVLPAYLSMKAIESPSRPDYVQW